MNKGHRLPDFDVLRGRGANESRDSVEDITQFEVGLKTATKLYSAFLTAYQNKLTNSQTQQFTNAGNVVLRPNSKATGLEFELALRPGAGFEIAGDRATSRMPSTATSSSYTGNRVERAPKFQARVTPSWQTQTGYGQLRTFATFSHVGERFADQTNTLKLPAYGTIDAGAVFSMDNGLELRLTGTNLTNKIGLTEGNFRVPGQGRRRREPAGGRDPRRPARAGRAAGRLEGPADRDHVLPRRLAPAPPGPETIDAAGAGRGRRRVPGHARAASLLGHQAAVRDRRRGLRAGQGQRLFDDRPRHA
ncbi:hypothetical protein OSTOST_04855 [Ostertagia ostertagi]